MSTDSCLNLAYSAKTKDNTTTRGLYHINEDRQHIGKRSNEEDDVLRDLG